jgi:TfoX/Sxy family transcriptional regulator of competence genes
MGWKKAPDKLVAFLAATLQDVACEPRKMFGYPVYFINNNLFIGAHQDDLFLRLATEDRDEVHAKYDTIKPFEPVPGRMMKEYVVIPPDLYTNPAIFQELLTKSIRYVASLPRKEKKKAASKRL